MRSYDPQSVQPGFGARPVVLVGRDPQLARAHSILDRVATTGGAAPSVLVLTGARGLGKTVTLDVIAEEAQDRGFLTASIAFDEASDNSQLLAGQIGKAVKVRADGMSRQLRHWLNELAIEINTGVVKFQADPGSPGQAAGGGRQPASGVGGTARGYGATSPGR